MRLMKKVPSILVLLCALLAYATGALALSGTEIAVLKIGKADAIVIMTGSHTVLIDAGEEEDAQEILSFFAERAIKTVDVMIVTHFDKDHVGGAAGVLSGIRVGVLYDADYEGSGRLYDAYEQAVKASGVPRFRVSEPLWVEWDELSFAMLPTALETDSDNDNSLVIAMADAWHTFLFAADAEEARIDELLAGGLDRYDVLKMPHHGRDKTNMAAFLQAVSPQIALITDSDKNPAEDAVLQRLRNLPVDTYQTRDGDIRVLSGAGGLTVLQ